MLWVADTLVILLLALLGFAAADVDALPAVVWLAVATPALVRDDLRHRRLPNGLTLPAVGLVCVCSVGGLVTDLIGGTGAQDPTWSLASALVTAAPGRLAARAGVVGMGDVKLTTALVGSLVLACGTGALWSFAVVASATGAALGARRTWRIGRRGGPRTTSAADCRLAEPPGVPYGPCLLLGYWLALAIGALT